jgi:predicted amidophosphoribosyltransferase
MTDERVFCPCCGTELKQIDYDYDNGNNIYYCENCNENMTESCDIDDIQYKKERIEELENFKQSFLNDNKLSFLEDIISPSSIKQIECIILDNIDEDVYRLNKEIDCFED